jgi:hypothetical protein
MSDPLHTVMVERLGCRWPIIQTAGLGGGTLARDRQL